MRLFARNEGCGAVQVIEACEAPSGDWSEWASGTRDEILDEIRRTLNMRDSRPGGSACAYAHAVARRAAMVIGVETVEAEWIEPEQDQEGYYELHLPGDRYTSAESYLPGGLGDEWHRDDGLGGWTDVEDEAFSDDYIIILSGGPRDGQISDQNVYGPARPGSKL